MRIWDTFFRLIQYSALIYIVSSRDVYIDSERMVQARQHVHHLLNEEGLRECAMCIIVNQHKDAPYDQQADMAHYQLDLHRLDPWNARRTRKFVVDLTAIRGTRDRNWVSMLDFVGRCVSRSK